MNNLTKAGICGSIALKASPAEALVSAVKGKSRQIVERTRGNLHGPITRLVSPGDLGQLMKPFIFLDAFHMSDTTGFKVCFNNNIMIKFYYIASLYYNNSCIPLSYTLFLHIKGFGWHPHSGIATVTVLLEGSLWYEETTSTGEVEEGGVEFFRAAGGAWHRGGPKTLANKSSMKGYQLWVALPEKLENGEPDSHYLSPAQVPTSGPARVILGKYLDAESTIPSTPTMNYLDVRLKAGEKWTYHTPEAHNVAFVAVHQGVLKTDDGEVPAGELAIFNESAPADSLEDDGALSFEAIGDTSFMLGTAVKHPYDLSLGRYSVHTSADALKKGEARINVIGRELKAKGVI